MKINFWQTKKCFVFINTKSMELFTCFLFLSPLIDLVRWVSRNKFKKVTLYFQYVKWLFIFKMYVYLPAGTVFLSLLLFVKPSLYSSRRQSFDTQPPYEGRAGKQRTLIKKGRSVFGDKGVDNNNSCNHWLVNWDLWAGLGSAGIIYFCFVLQVIEKLVNYKN